VSDALGMKSRPKLKDPRLEKLKRSSSSGRLSAPAPDPPAELSHKQEMTKKRKIFDDDFLNEIFPRRK